jgi:hypothetical protein
MVETNINERTYCEVHPDRETELRCNKCGRLMCADCAVSTPVGYRCRECVRGIRQKFYNAEPGDYMRVALVCAAACGIATGIVGIVRIPLLFLLLLGLPLGGAIAELTVRAVNKRRGEHIDRTAAAGAAVGGLIGALAPVFVQYNQIASQAAARGVSVPPLTLDVLIEALLRDWTTLIFIALVTAAIYGRYRMRA